MENWYDFIAPFFEPLGITPPDLVLIVAVLGGLLFGAADYRIGLMSTLMMLIGVVSYFIFYGFDTMRAFILIFCTIIIMAISLYVERSRGTGGFI
jgi:hypothetical protein